MKQRCLICLKYYSTKGNLKKHEGIICKQKFECLQCMKLYSSRFRLKNHKCKEENIDYNINKNNKIKLILQNCPEDKNIIINYNDYSKNELNNNSKNEINNNSKNDITINKFNFLETTPMNFKFDYKTNNIQLNDLRNIDNYSEELADKFMYEEVDFKKLQQDIIYKYDKEALQVEGMKILFTRLQKDPDNRNVMIRKNKSGKCFIYETEWIEQKLQKIILKICNKLCDTLYDKETSMNHFFRLVIGSQPRRYSELRKHIEEEILNIKEDNPKQLIQTENYIKPPLEFNG